MDIIMIFGYSILVSTLDWMQTSGHTLYVRNSGRKLFSIPTKEPEKDHSPA